MLRGYKLRAVCGGMVLSCSCLSAMAEEPALLADAVAPPAPATATVKSEVEVVTERYPNGTPRVRREVTQDAYENYVNHGLYESYDPQGNVIMSGEFRMGRQDGLWTRIFNAGEAELFSGTLDRQFKGPFASSADFVNGELHGLWEISNKDGLKIIQWGFANNKPHGVWTWYYPNGQIRKQQEYRNGHIDGEAIEYTQDGQITSQHRYAEGRLYTTQTETHAKGVKKSEGMVYVSGDTTVSEYDWWAHKVHTEVLAKPVPVKDGQWNFWYSNGQLQMTGHYKDGVQHGKFTWWRENGQKQAEGEYVNGQMHGEWTTWHPNGLKETVGQYEHGAPTGRWRRWDGEGRVAESQEFHKGSEIVKPREMARPQEVVNDDTAPQADPQESAKPVARTPVQGAIRRAQVPNRFNN